MSDNEHPGVEEKDGQLLHLVFGGELDDISGVTFRDLDGVDIVGLFPSYESAHAAWKSKAQLPSGPLVTIFTTHLAIPASTAQAPA